MIENRDIIVVGLQPWDTEIGSNCRDVAIEFSKRNRVLYVNYPLDRGTWLKNRTDPKMIRRMNVVKGREDGLVQIGDRFWNLFPDVMAESINWIKSNAVFNWLNKRNGRLYAGSIQKAMDRLGFRDVILFNDNDILRSFYLKELLQPKTSVYYYRDYILGVDYWKVHGTKLEPLLIAKSDICCTNSHHFRDYCLKYNPRSYYVGQGCDLEQFTDKGDMPVAADMLRFSKPVIGYVGALQSLRLDLGILEEMAKSRPEWNIVLVGPEDSVFEGSRLHLYPNVHFLGGRPPEVLPQYIKAFDVCLNPQLINEVTIGNYPRKIDEYLAMGKPVVATRTEFMDAIFADHTYLGTTAGDYIRLIERALAEDSPALQLKRKQYAALHSWEAHVNEIYTHISDFEKGNPY